MHRVGIKTSYTLQTFVVKIDQKLSHLEQAVLDFDVEHLVVADLSRNRARHVLVAAHHVGQRGKDLEKKMA